MTASAPSIAPNLHATPNHGVRGASGEPGATAGDALAGFEALLAALFPQTGPTAPKGGPGEVPALGLEADKLADKDAATDEAPAAGADAAAAAALAASVAAVQAETPADPNGAPALEDGSSEPHAEAPAWGRDKPKGSPAAPALAHANANAGLAEKVGAPADSAPEPSEVEDGAGVTGEASGPAAETAPPSWGQEKPKGAPAGPALANANPKADLAAKAAPPAETAELPPGDLPLPQDLPPAVAAETAAEAAAPPPAPPARTGKTERGKAVAEAPTLDPQAPEPAGRPGHAQAVTAAARPASAQADAPKAEDAPVKAEVDISPEAMPPAEAAAAAEAASAPAPHATHAVRGSPETVASLAAQIIKKLEARSTRFDLELDPVGLGKVDVRLEIGAHGRLTAAMTFDNPQAAADLKARAAELQRVLEQAGFDLSGGLSFDVAGDHRHQGQAWQDQGEAGQAFRGQAFRTALETAGEAADAAAQGALRLYRGVTAGLDLRI